MIANYSNDCDYLRKRFNLPNTITLYKMVNVVTDYLRDLDDKEELEKLSEVVVVPKEPKIEEPQISKPSQVEKKGVKRGLSRK